MQGLWIQHHKRWLRDVSEGVARDIEVVGHLLLEAEQQTVDSIGVTGEVQLLSSIERQELESREGVNVGKGVALNEDLGEVVLRAAYHPGSDVHEEAFGDLDVEEILSVQIPGHV